MQGIKIETWGSYLVTSNYCRPLCSTYLLYVRLKCRDTLYTLRQLYAIATLQVALKTGARLCFIYLYTALVSHVTQEQQDLHVKGGRGVRLRTVPRQTPIYHAHIKSVESSLPPEHVGPALSKRTSGSHHALAASASDELSRSAHAIDPTS